MMTVPTQADVGETTREALSGLASGDLDVLMDAPPASYMWQVANALDSGATPAPEVMVALGLSLPDGV
jgi:hypothetical protein